MTPGKGSGTKEPTRVRRLADPPPAARRACYGLALAVLTLAIAVSVLVPAFAVTGI